MIYFIAAGKHIKIGYSVDPVSRLKELQTGNPLKLSIRATIQNGCFKTETGLHEMFEHLRKKGEWFRYTDELLWFTHAVRKYPEEQNIKTLYMNSQAMRLVNKAKTRGPEHKLSKRIKGIKRGLAR